MKKNSALTDFAPADLTDGRNPLEWQSNYSDPAARRAIRFEAAYLAGLLLAVPISILTLWLGYPRRWLGLSEEMYQPILRHGLAWFGGLLGGTLLSIKWLYHVVARQLWHLDRRLWRLFTPHISGALAFVVVGLVSSKALGLFDRQAIESRPFIVGMAFIIGYFSDNALASLAEIAEKFFGANRTKTKQGNARGAQDSGTKEEEHSTQLKVASTDAPAAGVPHNTSSNDDL